MNIDFKSNIIISFVNIVLLKRCIGSVYYSTGTINSYTWKNSYPQSCECIESGVSSSDCSLFKCTCSCDLTAGKCDYGCCCDIDCNDKQISRFELLSVCLPEGHSASFENFCYSTDELSRVNPRTPLSGTSTSQNAIDALLCVEKKNVAYEGEFYKNVELQSSSIFSTSEGQKDYDYSTDDVTETTADNYFDHNDTIPAFYNTTSNSFVSFSSGYFKLPRSDFTGYCNDENNVKFEISESNSCIRKIITTDETAFENACIDGYLSIESLVTRLYLGRHADTIVPATLSAISNTVSVSLSAVIFEDFYTGNQIDITSQWLSNYCTSSYFPVTFLSSSPTISPTNLPTQLPTTIPSTLPTNSPTTLPSVIPTRAEPSSRPSIVPTSPPTSRPSMNPTSRPSLIPTNTPTIRPTNLPISSPTTPPTDMPLEINNSYSPSSLPTRIPSSEPTSLPTSIPTVSPSSRPSQTPTSQPTNQSTQSTPNNQTTLCGIPYASTYFYDFPQCTGAVKSVQYTVTHSQTSTSTIVAVTANVTVTNIPYDLGNSSAIRFKQTFGVSFNEIGESAKSRSSSNGNLVNRTRSGNPGYLIGSPVLFAVTAVNSSTVNELTEGFTIPAPMSRFNPADPSLFGTGACPRYDDDGLIAMNRMALKFGYDTTTGCVMRLNHTEFMNVCCEGADSCRGPYDSTYVSADGVPLFLTPSSGLIGIYGNADPLDKSQWQSLVVSSASTSTRQWNDKTGVCKNMITGLNYRFLVAFTGEKSFPQRKIVAAESTYTYSDITYRNLYADKSSKLSVPLQITVSYIYINNNDLRGYTPPSPPLLFKVPYDVFYPFSISSASSPYTYYQFQSVSISTIGIVPTGFIIVVLIAQLIF